MLVVLASRFDRSAVEFVEHSANTHLLTPADLSRPGWKDFSGGTPTSLRRAPGTAVIGGRVVATDELTGVLVRLPIVMPQELSHIVPDDREYVAAEITAFLVSWLSKLSCPVLNRPTPLCLAGPMWQREKWLCIAAEFGIAVCHQPSKSSRSQNLRGNRVANVRQVIIVGDRCIGNCRRFETSAVPQLARAAGVEFLQLDFAGSELVSVSVLPSIGSVKVRAAVLNYFAQAAS